MNILITGGAGFIGSHVIEHHLNRGDEVVAVDDLSTGNRSNIRDFERNPRFRFVPSDITDYPELDHAVRAADRIYHLAAVVGMFRVLREPVRVTQVNVCATEHLLETIAAAGHHPQVVIASSSSVYSHCHSRDLREDDELVYLPRQGGLTGYALSKLTNEIQAMAYRAEYGLQVKPWPAKSSPYSATAPRPAPSAMCAIPWPLSTCLRGTARRRVSRSMWATNARRAFSISHAWSSNGPAAARKSNSCLSIKLTVPASTRSPSGVRWGNGCAA